MKNLPQKKSTQRPSLSNEAKSWMKRIIETFEIDDPAGLLLLESAMEALDDMRLAQAILSAEGLTIKDRWGQQKQHPATLVLRDSRNLMLRSLKQLNLDIAPGAPLGKK
jgi:phage terminase small subunit